MKHPACGLRRIHLPRTSVNKGKKEGPEVIMLRRRTSPPETLRYASESPAGAGLSW